jgi:hypothetical protein
MDEPLQRGDLVTIRDEDPQPFGRIVAVTGDRAEIAWHRRAGHDRGVTSESTISLRRVHESEMETTQE